jgi:hypothetical protein
MNANRGFKKINEKNGVPGIVCMGIMICPVSSGSGEYCKLLKGPFG